MFDAAEDEAVRWALRHPLGPDEEDALERWLALDPRHPGQLLRAMAALTAVDRALVQADVEKGGGDARFSRRRLFVGAGGAIAATAVGTIGWSILSGEQVTTRRGEIRRLPLRDGSVATINTESELRVVFGQNDRKIVLDRGEAWFQVAKDRERPFVVDAGIAQARAVGTAFSVEREDDGVRIRVTEGIVAAWAADASGAVTLLQAGQQAYFPDAASPPKVATAPAAVERTLAWRNGEIALENETLAHAVTQFNRYNRQQLVIDDPALGEERLVGLFQIDKPADFAATLAASHDVSVTVTTSSISLRRRIRERD